MSLTTVACVLRSGGQYDASWVGRLERAAARHLAPDRFVCLSDMDVPCERIPLEHGWPGWWSKLELFRPGLFDGTVFYVDLDTLLVGDCTAVWGYTGRFAMLRDFMRGNMAASGLMLWRAGGVGLYETALREIRTGRPAHPNFLRANRRMDFWINRHETPDILQSLYPGLVGSFKVDGLQQHPQDYRIVCFHGTPKPAEVQGWVAEAWAA